MGSSLVRSWLRSSSPIIGSLATVGSPVNKTQKTSQSSGAEPGPRLVASKSVFQRREPRTEEGTSLLASRAG